MKRKFKLIVLSLLLSVLSVCGCSAGTGAATSTVGMDIQSSVSDNTKISDQSSVSDNTKTSDQSSVSDDTKTSDQSSTSDNAEASVQSSEPVKTEASSEMSADKNGSDSEEKYMTVSQDLLNRLSEERSKEFGEEITVTRENIGFGEEQAINWSYPGITQKQFDEIMYLRIKSGVYQPYKEKVMLGLAEKSTKRPSLDQIKQIIEDVKNDSRFQDDLKADGKGIEDYQNSKGYNIVERIENLHDPDFILTGTGTSYFVINSETDTEYFDSIDNIPVAGKEVICFCYDRYTGVRVIYKKYNDENEMVSHEVLYSSADEFKKNYRS